MAFKRKLLNGIEILKSSLLPSGAIVWFNLTAAPTGWILCDGRQYQDKNGVTRTAPNLIGRYPLGATGNIGQFIASGLPDHSHYIQFIRDQFNGTRGNAGFGDEERDGYQDVRTRMASETECVYGRYQNTPEFKNKVVPDSVRLLTCMKL